MNVFDRDAAEQDENRRASAILAAWRSFLAATDELLASYNRHPKGQAHPASIVHRTDASVVIQCDQGRSRDAVSSLMVTITARIVAESVLIEGTVERWQLRLPGAPRQLEGKRNFLFELAKDGRMLMYSGDALTPGEAAEKLLAEALL